MEKICYLIGAMEPECVLFSPKKSQLGIAADGGLRHRLRVHHLMEPA